MKKAAIFCVITILLLIVEKAFLFSYAEIAEDVRDVRNILIRIGVLTTTRFGRVLQRTIPRKLHHIHYPYIFLLSTYYYFYINYNFVFLYHY